MEEPVIGAVVTWTLSRVEIPRATLREQLREIGLGSAMGRDPSPVRMLSKAVGVVQRGRSAVFLRKLSKGCWAVISEMADGVLTHTHEVTMQVGVGSDLVVTSAIQNPSPEALQLVSDVRFAYDRAKHFANIDDISAVLTCALHGTDTNPMLGAISLRPGAGGVYFVAGSVVHRVQQLRDLLHRLAPASHMTVLSMHGGAGNQEEAIRAARNSFDARLEELRAELGTFVAEMTAGGRTMVPAHVTTRVERLSSLQCRVAMWGDVLGDVRSDLDRAIAVAKAEVAEAMGLEMTP